MKLLPSQKNTLFDLIENSGLSPSQFTLENYISTGSSVVYTELRYKNSEFFFRFSLSNNGMAPFRAVYCPAENLYSDDSFFSSWESEMEYFHDWLKLLAREISTPNKWERLKNELEGIGINFENNEDKFSVSEYEDLKQRVMILKQGTAAIALLPEQLATINNKLDHLTELAKEMNKFDWKSLFLGSIMSIIIQLGVTKENANELWALIKRVFNNYILP